MQSDLLQSDIEALLERHAGLVLEQDVGPLLGVLAIIARELAHADAATTLYEQAIAAALTDQTTDRRQLVWSRIVRRASRDELSTDDARQRATDVHRGHSSSAW